MAGRIRQPINLENLEKYIKENVPEITVPLDVKQFGYGQSNPTYQLTDATGKKFVMRKKPPGKLLSKTAHQVDREYRVIAAMQNTDVPVPKAIVLCQDDSVIGTAFYIMSFLQGRIFEDPSFPGVTPEHRREMWKSALTTLGKYHRLKPKELGMSDFGKEWGFYDRQLKTFSRLNDAQGATKDKETGVPVGPIPHYEEMAAFFAQKETQPKDRTGFVHGDYKIDNVVFHPTEPYVIGVLDWELATIGHPLSDLCNLLNPFTTADNPLAGQAGRQNTAFKRGVTPGLPTKEECIKWYSEVAGYKVEPRELKWGEAFGIYRGAVIMQGIAARYAERQASSERAQDYGKMMKPHAEMAWQFIQQLEKQSREEGQMSGHDQAAGRGYMAKL